MLQFFEDFTCDECGVYVKPLLFNGQKYLFYIDHNMPLHSSHFIVSIGFSNSNSLIPKNSFPYPDWFKSKYVRGGLYMFLSVFAGDVYKLYDELTNTNQNCYHCGFFDTYASPSKKTGKLVCYKCCDRY